MVCTLAVAAAVGSVPSAFVVLVLDASVLDVVVVAAGGSAERVLKTSSNKHTSFNDGCDLNFIVKL